MGGRYPLMRQVAFGTSLLCDDCGGPRTRVTRKNAKTHGRCRACYLAREKRGPKVMECVDCQAPLGKNARWKNSKTGVPTKRCRSCAGKFRHHQKRVGERTEDTLVSNTEHAYVDDKGRWHLSGPSNEDGDNRYGALHKAWLAFKITKGRYNRGITTREKAIARLEGFAKVINRLEGELDKTLTEFDFSNY